MHSWQEKGTNGTVINMSKLIKGQTHLLQNGDVIYFVYRKSEPQQNIAYVYHTIKMEQGESLHSYGMESSAQSYSAVPESEMILSVKPLILTKTPRDLAQDEPKPSTSASHFCIENPSSSGTTVITTSSSSGPPKHAAPAQKHDTDHLEPKLKRRKMSDVLDKECASDLPFTAGPEVAGSADKDSSKSAVKETKTDKMEESLTCVICQDLLHDCISTNGTVINMSKLIKGQTHLLQNGDVIYFVYRKSEPQQNIAYVYHTIKMEQGESLHSYGMESSAQSYSAVPESEMILSVEPLILTKTPRDLAQDEPKPSTSASHFCIENPSSSGTTVITTSSSSGPPKHAAPAQKHDTDHLEPKLKRRKMSDVLDKECASDLPFTACPEVAGSADKDSSKSAVKETKTDKMEESLTCVICQDLLHDCISLQPCMHVFCAACYSGWMERSSLCPTCRCPVERICKNHFLNNLVEAYLTQHPEKCRSEEDLKSMDSRNKITQDMLQPKVERLFSDEEGSSDYLFESSDNDSDSSDTSQPLVMCRQCPGYRSYMSQVLLTTSSNCWFAGLPSLPAVLSSAKPAGEEEAAKLTGEQPSTSSEATSASQVYCCPPQGRHVLCTCCLQPMPDRRAELSSLPGFAQQCMLCQQPFCHMYWGCQRIGCQGCLSRFSELNLNDKCLDSVLNNNTYESEVLKNHLSSKGKTWKDLLQESLEGLQEGSFSLTDNVSGNTILCFCCGLRAFKELAYKYRQNIPASELPATVTSRPDCYWGRNCRTQVKAHHATKFNHICEQTRFKN